MSTVMKKKQNPACVKSKSDWIKFTIGTILFTLIYFFIVLPILSKYMM